MLKDCNTDTEKIARNVSISNEKESNRFKRNWSQLNMKYYPCTCLEIWSMKNEEWLANEVQACVCL